MPYKLLVADAQPARPQGRPAGVRPAGFRGPRLRGRPGCAAGARTGQPGRRDPGGRRFPGGTATKSAGTSAAARTSRRRRSSCSGTASSPWTRKRRGAWSATRSSPSRSIRKSSPSRSGRSSTGRKGRPPVPRNRSSKRPPGPASGRCLRTPISRRRRTCPLPRTGSRTGSGPFSAMRSCPWSASSRRGSRRRSGPTSSRRSTPPERRPPEFPFERDTHGREHQKDSGQGLRPRPRRGEVGEILARGKDQYSPRSRPTSRSSRRSCRRRT